jgi:hypothetical protein
VNVVVRRLSVAGASSAAKAPCSARAEEDGEARREAAERGRRREAGEAGDEDASAAEEIAEAPAEQQQAAERQRVRGDDPLARLVREAQRLLGGGQRDVHDRRVEHDQDLRHADEGEDQAADSTAG